MTKEQTATKGLKGPKRTVGRPTVEHPKQTTAVRLGADMRERLDAWALANGEIGRSAVIRQALARFLRDGAEK